MKKKNRRDRDRVPQMVARGCHSHKVLEGYNLDGKEFPEPSIWSALLLRSVSRRRHEPARWRKSTASPSMKASTPLSAAAVRNSPSMACCASANMASTHQRARSGFCTAGGRFFEEVCKVFARSKKSVPVSTINTSRRTWADAKWMYDRPRAVCWPFPGRFLATSGPWGGAALKLPLDLPSWRQRCRSATVRSRLRLPTPWRRAMHDRAAQGRRKPAVKAVTCLTARRMWKALDDGEWSKELWDRRRRAYPGPCQRGTSAR